MTVQYGFVNRQGSQYHLRPLYGNTRLDFQNRQLTIGLLVSCKVSTANGCPYCIGHTGGMLREVGFEKKELDGIAQLDIDLFSEAERLALEFTEQATKEPARVSDTLVEQLKQHFSEGEVVEIAGVISLMNFTNKAHEALAIPLEGKFLH